jgi:serine phosphatase RsbU (regulator of sigma subunit)
MDDIQIDSVPLFSSLPGSEIKFLVNALRRIEFEAGTVLFHEGEKGDKFYIILAGQVEIIKSLGKTDEHVLARRGPTDFIGEMSLFIPDGFRTASIRTCSSVKLMELSRTDFDNLLQRRPALAYEMVRVLSLRLRKSDNAMIRDLKEKNRQLAQMYQELQAAQAQIVEKEKLEHELYLARDIQESILPGDLALLEDFDFGARMLPARSVGGDLYDVIPLDQDMVGIAIGDVSGKGVPAALFMALFCSLLRVEVRQGISPAEVLRRINHHLLNYHEMGMFVTVLFGIVNRRRREFAYARAGHEIPILFDRGGGANMLDWNHGQLLGFFPNPKLDEQTVIIPRGSTLLLYTDGAINALDSERVSFGVDRLMKTAGANTQTFAQNLCDLIIEDLNAYQGTSSQFDDITLVAIQSSPGAPHLQSDMT